MLAIFAALFVIIALPVGQLRLSHAEKSCCCPDPAKCKCPDHRSDPSKGTSIERCHKTPQHLAGSSIPAFTAPVAIAVMPAVRIADVSHVSLSEPHAAPAPRRPDAPS